MFEPFGNNRILLHILYRYLCHVSPLQLTPNRICYRHLYTVMRTRGVNGVKNSLLLPCLRCRNCNGTSDGIFDTHLQWEANESPRQRSMPRVILYSDIANRHELVDPDCHFGEDISQNDRIPGSTSWYQPLLIDTFLFPPLNRLKDFVNINGGIKFHADPTPLLEL